MRKTFCDSCGTECTGRFGRMEIPIHIVNPDDMGYAIIEKNSFIPTSGRYEEFDLCLPCFNGAHAAAMEFIRKGDK